MERGVGLNAAASRSSDDGESLHERPVSRICAHCFYGGDALPSLPLWPESGAKKRWLRRCSARSWWVAEKSRTF